MMFISQKVARTGLFHYSNFDASSCVFFQILVFETFYIDVNLERTNSTCVLISPGCGVFDVDRELTGMTKQRLMDAGMFQLPIE